MAEIEEVTVRTGELTVSDSDQGKPEGVDEQLIDQEIPEVGEAESSKSKAKKKKKKKKMEAVINLADESVSVSETENSAAETVSLSPVERAKAAAAARAKKGGKKATSSGSALEAARKAARELATTNKGKRLSKKELSQANYASGHFCA